ncbi:MAG: CbiQ family ECF transporter T component [Rhodospirillaceae bacterium]|nr:CbiQ family ECF transporter T component [Rhodospirillaceae bacterium]
MIGAYVPGDSALHRLSAGFKLIGLAATALLIAWANGFVLGAMVVALAVVWVVAGLGVQHLRQTLLPLVWIAAAIFVFQIMLAGIGAALIVTVKLAALVAAAALVTFTTRTSDMLSTLTRALKPLARFGVNGELVAMAVVFVVRLVPVVAALGRETLDARLARGAGRNPLAVALPLAIRLMRQADVMAEALLARGFGQR